MFEEQLYFYDIRFVSRSFWPAGKKLLYVFVSLTPQKKNASDLSI